MTKTLYKAVGAMSGTSLDGLDLAYCEFYVENSHWHYHLICAETIEYTDEWRERLKNAVFLSGLELSLLNTDYGHFLGKQIHQFLTKNQLDADLISVHGHTIFHQPEKQLTLQIGDGAALASYMKCPVVTQFRNIDVALGGQGAPLVPIGDRDLFEMSDFRLNLGGIANISFSKHKNTTAFDICVCNMALNFLASLKGFSYDQNGDFASSGQLHSELLEQLNNLDFFNQQPPKSLSFEWFNEIFKPVLQMYDTSVETKLRTICEHIAKQISNVVNAQQNVSTKTMLVTGGGAKNIFLLKRLKQLCLCNIQECHPQLIDFKEALIFAFLGVLRIRNEINCLANVTGAKQDNIGGCVYLGQVR